ncbi:hypothetical protein ABWL39_19980 [Chitinivorax sp. PXF-14]|uniref:hypothetical protein n=1 Tax=Chitinivorax sp. PXF-14 TaxID=3230488 RepID=UPI00346680F5
MKLKSTITVLKLQDYAFKNSVSGEEIKGSTITFMGDDMVSHTTSVKNETLDLFKKSPLPAVFECELEPIIKQVLNQKAQLKFTVHSAKFLKEVKFS